ncbi:MAG: hypothetical protein CMD18_01715 [Flavobacteriales bacterium]|nr:hypothetical protein [Flavobacteriales bacterium]
MERINALGDSSKRLDLFTKELLAETNDAELQEIVKTAANELNSPIALVSLVLDQIQFFKAHIGLPPVLEIAKGTHRDVSFCQFVVRDGKTFEVTDASNDPRVPQHVVNEYNIQSYLGVPIMVDNNVMGSLCVLDTKKRGFSEKEHIRLNKLALLVNKRLESLALGRRQSRLDLTESTLKPALSELSKSLKSIEKFISTGHSADRAIGTFINHSSHLLSSKPQFSESLILSLEAAKKANQVKENLVLELELAAKDGLDCVKALQEIVMNFDSTHLSEVLTSAQDLSRNATNLIGGFPLPDLEINPKIYTKGNFTIGIITNCILLLSSELGNINSKNGIELETKEREGLIDLLFSGKDLSENSTEEIVFKLKKLIGIELPTLSINSLKNKIQLTFKTIENTEINKSNDKIQDMYV